MMADILNNLNLFRRGDKIVGRMQTMPTAKDILKKWQNNQESMDLDSVLGHLGDSQDFIAHAHLLRIKGLEEKLKEEVEPFYYQILFYLYKGLEKRALEDEEKPYIYLYALRNHLLSLFKEMNQEKIALLIGLIPILPKTEDLLELNELYYEYKTSIIEALAFNDTKFLDNLETISKNVKILQVATLGIEDEITFLSSFILNSGALELFLPTLDNFIKKFQGKEMGFQDFIDSFAGSLKSREEKARERIDALQEELEEKGNFLSLSELADNYRFIEDFESAFLSLLVKYSHIEPKKSLMRIFEEWESYQDFIPKNKMIVAKLALDSQDSELISQLFNKLILSNQDIAGSGEKGISGDELMAEFEAEEMLCEWLELRDLSWDIREKYLLGMIKNNSLNHQDKYRTILLNMGKYQELWAFCEENAHMTLWCLKTIEMIFDKSREPHWLIKKGHLLGAMGDYQEALVFVRQAMRLGADIGEEYEKLALEYGDISEKIEILWKKAEDFPQDEQIKLKLAELLIESDKQQAMAFMSFCFENASSSTIDQIMVLMQKKYSDDPQIRKMAADYALKTGDAKTARDILLQILNSSWDIGLAKEAEKICQDLGDHNSIKELIDLDPRNGDLLWKTRKYTDLYQRAFESENMELAQELAQSLRIIAPNNIQSWLMLIRLRKKQERYDLIPEIAEQMFSILPGDGRIILAELEGLINHLKDDLSYRKLLTKLYNANGDFDKELEQYLALSKIDPGENKYLNGALGILVQFGRLEEALDLVDRIYSLRYDSTHIKTALGVILNAAEIEGKNQLIEIILRKLITIKPDEPSYYLRLGNLYINQNKLDSAFGTFEEVILLANMDQDILETNLEKLEALGFDSPKLFERLADISYGKGAEEKGFFWNLKRLKRDFDRNIFFTLWQYNKENKKFNDLLELRNILNDEKERLQRLREIYRLALVFGDDHEKHRIFEILSKEEKWKKGDTETYREWIEYLVKTGRYKAGLKHIKSLLEMDDPDGWTTNTLKEIAKKSKNIEIAGYYASFLALIGNAEEAITEYKKIVMELGGHKWLSPLDELLQSYARWDEIIDIYSKVYKNDKNFLRRRFRQLLSEKSHISFKTLAKIQDFFPSSPEYIEALLKSSADEGRFSEIPPLLIQLYHLSPGSWDLILSYISRLKIAGRDEDQLLNLEISLLEERREYTKAARVIINSFESGKINKELLSKGMKYLLMEDKVQEILSIYSRFPQVEGDEPSIFWRDLSHSAERADDKPLQLHIMEKRARLQPDNCEIIAKLAGLYLDNEKFEESEKSLERLFELKGADSIDTIKVIMQSLRKKGHDSINLSIMMANFLIIEEEYEKAYEELKEYHHLGRKEIFQRSELCLKKSRNVAKLWHFYNQNIKDSSERREKVFFFAQEQEKDNPRLAIKIYESLLDEYPEDLELGDAFGRLLCELGEVEKAWEIISAFYNTMNSQDFENLARKIVEKARDKKGQWGEILLEKVTEKYIGEGKLDKVADLILELAVLKGQEPLLLAGYLSLKHGIIQIFQDMSQISPSFAENALKTIKKLADDAIKQSKAHEAFWFFLYILNYKPNDSKLVIKCSESARMAGLEEIMISSFREIMKKSGLIGSESVDSIMQMADIYISLGKYDDALSCAMILKKHGKTKSILELFRRIRFERRMAGLEEDLELCHQLSLLHREEGAVESAVNELITIYKANKQPKLLKEISEVLLRDQQLSRALQYLRDYVDDSGDESVYGIIKDLEKKVSKQKVWTMR